MALNLFGKNSIVSAMRRYGFTLIELLVIIGIIAFLIAILIPSLHRSRLQAKATVCTSNIKQLSITLFTYAADNGRFPYGFYSHTGMSPPEGGYSGSKQFDRTGWWWFNYLKGLYKKDIEKQTMLNCPSKHLNHPDLAGDILCGNYGVNLSICKMPTGKISQKEFVGEPLADTEVEHPAQTLLLVDSGYAIINWWYATDMPPISFVMTTIEDTSYVPGLSINHQRQFWQGQEYDALNGRHPGGTVNVGFVDGHVTRIKAEDLLIKKNSDGTYKNRSPLWLPCSK